MGDPNISRDPWIEARDSYMADLSPKERSLFENATLENLFEESRYLHQAYEKSSRVRKASRDLAPLLDEISAFGRALDVYANACPLIMSPLWGSIRVLLCVRQTFLLP